MDVWYEPVATIAGKWGRGVEEMRCEAKAGKRIAEGYVHGPKG
jgi:hypothetical protein